MEIDIDKVIEYFNVRRENILKISDLKDDSFGVVDKLMKHAALFEISQAEEHSKSFRDALLSN